MIAEMQNRTPRSMRPMDPALGLHRLKREFQKKFMAEQCDQLTATLDAAIEATFRDAPVRRRRYLVDRTGMERSPAGEEARLEWAMYRQWASSSCEPVEDCWTRIINFQVNLPAKRDDDNRDWGEIDLLGVAEDGLPVLIELKNGSSTEPPPRLVVQAAAYGLVLQKAWHFLRAEWIQEIAKHGITSPVPTALLPCRLVCAAPPEYWNVWSSDEKMRDALQRLRCAFAVRGLPSVFASVTGTAPGSIVVRSVAD